jgi:hypothetical protein
MKDEKNNFANSERKVQQFFQKQADSLKVSKDLWPKLESRLDEKLKDTESHNKKGRLWQWLAGPRLIAISASVGAVLILIVAGSLWLTTNNSANTINGSNPPISNGTILHGLGGDVRGSIVTAIPTTTTALPPSQVIVPSAPSTSGIYLSGNGTTFGPTDSNSGALDTIGKQVISQASVTLEVTTVSTAITQVETMAQNLGGSVDNMSSSGEQNQEQATLTIRVPQNQFMAALNQLQSMGTVQSQNVSTQDVTQQYIDLQAQLNSAQMEKQSLQAILAKATTVSDEIAIQEQLTQVESQVESLQGQINYLQNQVAMSTITVTLNTPTQNVGQPPSGSLAVAVSSVDNSLASVKQLVSSVKGIINSSTVSYNNGKENASLSLQVYSSDFDQVMNTIGKCGKIQMKTIQESVTSQQTGTQQSNVPPDASIYLTLNEATGFWTATHITIIAAAGAVLVILILFLVLAGRAGLLRRQTS